MNTKKVKGEENPIIYFNEESGKGVILNGARVLHVGCVRIKKKKYKYFQYRSGKKVIQIYLGKV